jgi:CDGSH-type Zn-finger protein
MNMENLNNISLKIIKGGPFVVSGNFNITLPTGEVKEAKDKTYLCRCGLSNNKPFCDGFHVKSDFDK